jgi:hypothetical protein
MRLREVIEVLNQMHADGVIDRYAIGGAVGATFYLEPVSTLDVDVFIELHAQADSLIIDLSPIYEYLEKKGGVREREYIVYADTPIQFLLPETQSLTNEALAGAVEKDVDGLAVRVFTAEHLAAIALQTNRSKDKTRLVQFIEEGALDMKRFQEILARHNLVSRWEQFEQTILSGER